MKEHWSNTEVSSLLLYSVSYATAYLQLSMNEMFGPPTIFSPIEFLLNYMFGTNIPFCAEVIQLFTVNTTVQ